MLEPSLYLVFTKRLQSFIFFWLFFICSYNGSVSDVYVLMFKSYVSCNISEHVQLALLSIMGNLPRNISCRYSKLISFIFSVINYTYNIAPLKIHTTLSLSLANSFLRIASTNFWFSNYTNSKNGHWRSEFAFKKVLNLCFWPEEWGYKEKRKRKDISFCFVIKKKKKNLSYIHTKTS